MTAADDSARRYADLLAWPCLSAPLFGHSDRFRETTRIWSPRLCGWAWPIVPI